MRNRTLTTAAVALALSGAGSVCALADEPPGRPAGPARHEGSVEVTETFTNSVSTGQDKELSEDGLTATRAISLARMALNDGDIPNAKNLLGEAQASDPEQLLRQALRVSTAAATRIADRRYAT